MQLFLTNTLPKTVTQLLLAMVEVVERTHPEQKFAAAAPSVSILPSTPSINNPLEIPPGAPETWVTHLKKVQDKVQQSNSPLTINFNTSMLTENYTILPQQDSSLTGSYYPNWPKIRTMPRLIGIDLVPTTKPAEWNDSQEGAAEAELFCQKEEKRSYETQKHTAGKFVASCLHKICYGHNHLTQPEGRYCLAKVLYEHFPKEVLDEMCVLYNFNCQAGEYLYNRFPETFSNIQLFIDWWHAASHTCSGVFKLQAYPHFQEFVSTGAEVLNSFLQLMRGQTPFMTQETEMAFINAAIGFRNFLVNEDLRLLCANYNCNK